MFDLNHYLETLITACKRFFGGRLLYVGLQGSYLRGEAHENSDIDVMVVIENLSVSDMAEYRAILKQIGSYEKSCGFLCGKEELSGWNPLEICHLLHTTKDLYGTLNLLLPKATRADEINYVKLSLGNVYHELCHRYIHADEKTNKANFRVLCKNFFFLIQNLHYLESGTFINTQKELKEYVSASDRTVLELSENQGEFDFNGAFAVAFAWCQNAFLRMKKLKSE